MNISSHTSSRNLRLLALTGALAAIAISPTGAQAATDHAMKHHSKKHRAMKHHAMKHHKY